MKENSHFNYFCNYNSPVVYFPIRHDSPASCLILSQYIKQYQPDLILVEFSHGIELLLTQLTKNTTFPVCITLSEIKKGNSLYLISDYSPEMVSIKYAVDHKIEFECIDVPPFLLSTTNYTETEENILTNKYTQQLLKETSCRNYDEWWAKYFEVGVDNIKIEDYIDQFYQHLKAIRDFDEMNQSVDLNIIERESYMRFRINENSLKYKRILVVTGGYHSVALKDKNSNFNIANSFNTSYLKAIIPASMKDYHTIYQGMLGMRHTNFYYHFHTFRNDHYIIRMIAEFNSQLKKNNTLITAADELMVYEVTYKLAQLRGNKYPTLYDYIDAVKTSFFKTDIIMNDIYLESLEASLVGSKIGTVPESYKVYPIIEDIMNTFKRFGLHNLSSITLHPTSKTKDLEISRFLNQLSVFETGLAVKKSKESVYEFNVLIPHSESWKLNANKVIETSQLLTLVNYGESLSSGYKNFIKFKLKSELKQFPYLLYNSILSGETNVTQLILDETAVLIKYFATIDLMVIINILLQGINEKEILGETLSSKLLEKSFLIYDFIVQTMYATSNIVYKSNTDYKNTIHAFLKLYKYLSKNAYLLDKQKLIDGLLFILDSDTTNNLSLGISLGVLLMDEYVEHKKFVEKMQMIRISNTKEELYDFILGVITVNHRLLTHNDEMIIYINQLLSELSDDEFGYFAYFLRSIIKRFLGEEKLQLKSRIKTVVFGKHQNTNYNPLIEKEIVQIFRTWGIEL
jgi:hypothetical protein